jgi:hypothetical protein
MDILDFMLQKNFDKNPDLICKVVDHVNEDPTVRGAYIQICIEAGMLDEHDEIKLRRACNKALDNIFNRFKLLKKPVTVKL